MVVWLSSWADLGDPDSPVGGTLLMTPGFSLSSAAVSGRLAADLAELEWLDRAPAEFKELEDPLRWSLPPLEPLAAVAEVADKVWSLHQFFSVDFS